MFKKMLLALALPLSIAVVLAMACNRKNAAKTTCVETPMKQDCSCYELYKPVCGCNGKTYSNDCYARCQGITDFKEGECPK